MTTLGTGVKNANNTSPVTINVSGTLVAGQAYFVSIVGNVVGGLDASFSGSDSLGNTWIKSDSIVNGSSCQVSQFYMICGTGGTNPTLTFTPANSVGRLAAVCDDPTVILAASPLDTHVTGSGNSTAVTAGSTGTLAQASEYGYVSAGFASGSTTSSVNNSFGLESMEVSTNGATDKRIQSADRTVSATTALNPTVTISGAVAWAAITATYKLAGSSFSGSAGLSGSGTLTAGGSPATSGAATLSGSGTLTASGAPAAPGSATLSGSGSLSASGSPSTSGATTLSGSGTLSASGIPSPANSATLSGSGTLSAAATPAIPSTAALSGSGTLTASGSIGGGSAFSGSAALSGSGTLSASGTPGPINSAALSGSGTLSASGKLGGIGSASLSGSGTLAASGTPRPTGAAVLSGSGTLVGAAVVAFVAAAAFSGSGQLDCIGFAGGIITPSPERTLVVYPSPRVLIVAAESRTVHVPPEPRDVSELEPSRILIVAAETRSVTA